MMSGQILQIIPDSSRDALNSGCPGVPPGIAIIAIMMLRTLDDHERPDLRVQTGISEDAE